MYGYELLTMEFKKNNENMYNYPLVYYTCTAVS